MNRTTQPLGGGEGAARNDGGTMVDPHEGDELQAQIADREEAVVDLETEEERYERAKNDLIRRVHGARHELGDELGDIRKKMSREEASEEDIEDAQIKAAEDKAEELANSFSESERMAVMKKLLKGVHFAHESEVHDKFENLIMIGLKLPFWDKNNYAFRLAKRTGAVEEKLTENREKAEVELGGLEDEWAAWESELKKSSGE